jgi:hypothetical protein
MLQIDDFVERIAHLIVLNILYKWQDARPITTIAPDGEAMFDMYQPIDGITAENLEWIVRSDIYARAPVTQASKRQQADALMQMQGQFNYNPPIITPEEWIQFQEFDMKEDILYRMEQDRISMENNKVSDMADMVSQLVQQALEAISQGASPEEVNGLIQQSAEQVIETQETEKMRNGSRPRDVAQEAQAPQGRHQPQGLSGCVAADPGVPGPPATANRGGGREESTPAQGPTSTPPHPSRCQGHPAGR